MKKLLAMVVCLCIIASLCACGGNQNSDGNDLDVQAYQEFLEEMSDCSIRAENARVVTMDDGTKYLTTDITYDNVNNYSISEIVVAFATWDENGTPIFITTANNPENTQNLIEMTLDDISISGGETWRGDRGLFIAETSYGVEYVTAIVTTCKMGQSQWENTLYDTWKKAYRNVLMESWKLETIMTDDSDADVSDDELADIDFTTFYTWLYGQDFAAFNADCEYQADGYSALMCDIKNYRDDATDIVVAFAMWDAAGEPLKINTQGGNSAYIIETELTDLTIGWDEIWTADRGLYITNDDNSVAYVEAIVVSAAVNGTTEENGMYDMWKENFGGKSLTSEQLAEMERIETSYTTWLDSAESNDVEEWATNTINSK